MMDENEFSNVGSNTGNNAVESINGGFSTDSSTGFIDTGVGNTSFTNIGTENPNPTETIGGNAGDGLNGSQPPIGSSNTNSYQKSPVYYTESYKKPKAKKSGMLQLILVALLASIFGGGVVFAAIVFVAPALLPTLGYSPVSAQNTTANLPAKKVEITQSTSPVSAIAEKVGPSIVGIEVTVGNSGQGFFFGQGQDSGSGEGSGIIIRQDGYILTNNHVVEGALSGNSNKLSNGSNIQVVFPNQKDKPYEATVIGRDVQSDIAVIKINATGLPAAELGDSDALKTGDLAVAIGNPGGMDYMGSVTAGIISGLNRSIQMDNGQELTLIQTDAAINPGNSGGALCNSQGQVIGVNTVKIAATGFEGLGFAIPINHAKSIAQSLIDYTYVKGRPYIGVSIDQTFNADVAKQYNVPNGLLVFDVTPLSAAYKAGVQRGDIITKFDGQTVTTYAELQNVKNKHKPGDKVAIEVYRDNAYKTLDLTLDEDKNQ